MYWQLRMLELVFINRINSSEMSVFGALSLVQLGDADSFLKRLRKTMGGIRYVVEIYNKI